MHSNRPLFSPEPSSAGEYVLVVLALLNNFHKTLRERQAQCLNKVRWGQPVIPGKHASFTIDRKHRGNPNLYDTDPNAPESDDDDDDDAEIEGGSQPKSASCGNEDSTVVIHPKLPENEERKEKFVLANEQNVPVQIENPLKLVPSLSKSFLHSNQEESPKYKTKKLKLCKKLSNKENEKQNVNLRCLRRRNLFRKSQPESSSIVLPSNHESQDVNSKQMQASVSNIASNGITSTTNNTTPTPTLPDTNIGEGREESFYSCDPMPGSVSKESTLAKKCSSPPRTPNCENGKASPLRENNPSNLCEVRSSSPVFSAKDSPFRNSEFGSHLKDCSMAKTEESTGSVTSVTNAEGMSSERHANPQSRLLEVEGQVVVDGRQKSETAKAKQKLMVQCPLCCEWFKLKVIEKHAANCGIIAPTKQDEQQNLGDPMPICNKRADKRESCDLNRPSKSENPKADPTRNTESDVLKTETTETVSVVQNLNCPILMTDINNSKDLIHQQHSTSPLAFEMGPVANGQTEQETRMETKSSDFVPVLKRCFICDLSYVDGKPFSTHLRACRKKYQKLKRQFSAFSDDSEEPRRKTRSHSFFPANTESSGETVNSNT